MVKESAVDTGRASQGDSMKITRRPWLVSEEKYLTDNYGRLSAKQCAENIDRTPVAIYRKVYAMGIASNKDYISGEHQQILG